MHEGKYTSAAKKYALASLETDLSPTGDPWVPAFEARFGELFGAGFSIAVSSGTSGLHAALLAVGVGPGDEVISPALTVVMDAYATLYSGAKPVFADVDPHTWNLNPAEVERLITPNTKAILTVSWFGLPSNLVELHRLAKLHSLALIDDSAETMLGRSTRGEDWNLPDIRVFSFESKKHFSTGGEGGMVTTDSPELAERVRKFAGIGYKHLGPNRGRTHLAARDFQNPSYLRFDKVGYNYRMNPLSAAVGLGQLEGIDFFLQSRRRCAELYNQAIDGISFLQPQFQNESHSYYTWGVRFDPDLAGISWQDFYDLFTEMGGDGFYANCMVPYLEPSLRGQSNSQQKFDPGLCPVAESLQVNVMAFKTNYLDLSKAESQADILRSVCLKVASD